MDFNKKQISNIEQGTLTLRNFKVCQKSVTHRYSTNFEIPYSIFDIRYSKEFLLSCTLFIILLFASENLLAQQENIPVVGVLGFTANGIEAEQAQKVTSKIETAIYNSKRFELVTRRFLDAIEVEREKSKEAINLDRVAIEQGKAVGAQYIVKGEVNRFDRSTRQKVKRSSSTVSSQRGIPQMYTSTTVGFTLEIVEVKTGIIKASDSYVGSMNGLETHIKRFIRKEFPYSFTVLEVLKKKGDKKAKAVLIDGGFKQGLYYSIILDVFEIIPEEVEGHVINREVEIGKMYVRAVDFSGNFSKCTVQKGKKTIFKKLEEGKIIVCRVPKNLKLFGMKFEYDY